MSSHLSTHLPGETRHVNPTTGWTVPLFALVSVEAVRSGSVRWAVAAGVVLAATAYTDYYFLVYEVVFAGCVYFGYTRRWMLSIRVMEIRHNPLLIAIALLVAIDVAVLVVSVFTRGFTWGIGSVTVSVHEPFNPAQVLSVLAVVAFFPYARPSLRTVIDARLLFHARRAVLVL